MCAGQIGRAGQKRQWSPRSRRGVGVSASSQAAPIERDKLVEFGVRHLDGRHHLGVQLDRLRLQDCQDDVLDAGEEFRERVARSRGVEQKLRVDDVLVAVGIKRENAHAGCRI